jgi:hypothetical protein
MEQDDTRHVLFTLLICLTGNNLCFGRCVNNFFDYCQEMSRSLKHADAGIIL